MIEKWISIIRHIYRQILTFLDSISQKYLNSIDYYQDLHFSIDHNSWPLLNRVPASSYFLTAQHP